MLIGDIGYSAADTGLKDNFTCAVLPYMSWNFLDLERNRTQVRQAKAGYEEAEAQYRSTVLNALKVQAMTDQGVTYSEQRYQAGRSV